MNEVLQYLINNNLKISFVESITGGNLAGSFIKIENASLALEESYIFYSNQVKAKNLGIDINEIDKYGVVSHHIASLMASKLHKLTGADITVSTTGYASGNYKREAYIGLYYKGSILVKHIVFDRDNSRVRNIEICVNEATNFIKETLKI